MLRNFFSPKILYNLYIPQLKIKTFGSLDLDGILVKGKIIAYINTKINENYR